MYQTLDKRERKMLTGHRTILTRRVQRARPMTQQETSGKDGDNQKTPRKEHMLGLYLSSPENKRKVGKVRLWKY